MKNAGVVGATMAWVALSGGVDVFEWWLRWRRWWFGGLVASMASMVGVDGGLGVFDTEGTDVEVPLCLQW